MQIVFVGPPGAGKGTQSARLIDYLDVPHLSTGEMFRRALELDTPLGREAAQHIEEGHLVPDDLVVDIVTNRLEESDCAQGCVLDGFPRTIAQAKKLDAYLASRGRQVDMVLALMVSRHELLDRLMVRRRADDSPQTIAKRLDVYQSQTEPLLKYYKRRSRLVSIDGTGAEDDVFARIRAQIDAWKARQQDGPSA